MDIKKVIEKLNKIKFKDLRNIDFSKLKEFDREQFKEEFFAQPALFINVLLIIVALFTVIFSFTYHKRNIINLATEITQMKEKLEVVNKQNETQKEYDQFFENIPETIPNNQIIGKLSEFAELSNVNILSFSPVKTFENDFMKLNNVRIIIESKSYDNFVHFMKAVEESPFSLRVNRWSASTKRMPVRTKKKDPMETPIEAQIEIGSIKLKDA